MTPLTSGLLLLSVTRLRQYAETTLPANSRLREGFLRKQHVWGTPGKLRQVCVERNEAGPKTNIRKDGERCG